LDRGFKAWCENISLQIRRELGQTKVTPLSPSDLAAYLDVRILEPKLIDGISNKSLNILGGKEKDNWSAITVSNNGRDIIVYNPAHSLARRSSDLMHELSHLLIGHKPSTLLFVPDATIALRSFDQKQEEEATWLSGALLLPRVALVSIRQSGLSSSEACEMFRVSNDLLNFRLNKTGVEAQFKRRRS